MKGQYYLKIGILFFAYFASMMQTPVFAYSEYFNQNPMGWHWNNALENTSVKKEREASEESAKNDPTDPNNPIAKMNRIHNMLRYAKDQAVLNPTVENIKDYLMIQNMIMQQSTVFSENWKKTMLLYPEFDYGISHPTDSAISQIAESDLHNKKIATVKMMSKHYGLLFFYNGRNPLSAQMTKTVESFSNFYGFSTLAVSVDHQMIPSSLKQKSDNGQAEALEVKALPALVLVNPQSGTHFVLRYGYASVNELLSDCYDAYSNLTQAQKTGE